MTIGFGRRVADYPYKHLCPREVAVKRTGMIVICAVVLLCAGAAQADTIDPVIIVRGASGSIPITGPTVILTYLNQPGCTNQTYLIPNISPNPLPGMACSLINMTNAAIASITFNITSAQLPLTLQCATLCSSFTSTVTGGTAIFTFSPPIPTAQPFNEIGVDFINFAAGTTIAVTATAVPEPGTIGLLLTGLGAIAARRRRLGARKS